MGSLVLQDCGAFEPRIFRRRQMTAFQRACQIWSVLAWAARNRQVLTYDIVARLIGMPRHGLGRMLEPIQSYCIVNKLEPLTVLVVSEQTGDPSHGFTAATENLSLRQLAVFTYDWLQ